MLVGFVAPTARWAALGTFGTLAQEDGTGHVSKARFSGLLFFAIVMFEHGSCYHVYKTGCSSKGRPSHEGAKGTCYDCIVDSILPHASHDGIYPNTNVVLIIFFVYSIVADLLSVLHLLLLTQSNGCIWFQSSIVRGANPNP